MEGTLGREGEECGGDTREGEECGGDTRLGGRGVWRGH